MILKYVLCALFLAPTYSVSYASDTHGKAGEKHEENHDENHEGLGEEKGHSHAHGEGEDRDEAPENVGPNKGITELSERNGFKLSPEALKNFDLKFLKLAGDGPWNIAKSAQVYSGEETNLFRRRSGFFKRIDFEIVRRSGDVLTIDSDDLRDGDEVITAGLGFLRIAEVAASGGVAHGHSH